MKFETTINTSHSPFELTVGMHFRPWAFHGLTMFINAAVNQKDSNDRFKVLATANNGDLFYVFQDIQASEIWTIQILSNGYVNSVDTTPDIRTAMFNIAQVISVDLEDPA